MNVINSSGKQITIDVSKEIGSGGEGTIYKLPNKQVAKIYHSHIKPSINSSFLSDISKLNNKFIKPVELFYNKANAIVGFSMDYLDLSKMHPFTDLSSKAICNQKGYNDKFKIDVVTSLSESLLDAHQKGVIIGDLNPYNLLFDDKGVVYFIDVDSYQTKNRPHSGIMLPDIRDWINHKISESSDYYSLSVLAFNLSTFVHPFKGVHKKYKKIEERVLRHLSLLSGDKDIIIPSFYEPISNSNIVNQFYDIYQQDKRFLVDISGINTIKKSVPLVTTTIIKSLSIKHIANNVRYYVILNNVLCIIGKNNKAQYFDVNTHSSFSKSSATFKNLPMTQFKSGEFFVELTEDTYTIYDSKGFQTTKQSIFSPSLTKGNEVFIQSIAGQKWLLWASKMGLVTLRTTYDIRDAYKRERFFCVKIKESNIIKTYLAEANGLKLELGSELEDMRNFCVIGDNIFVPEDKKIDVYSSLRKIAEIECDFVTENSILESCKSGIICQTDDQIFLINKI